MHRAHNTESRVPSSDTGRCTTPGTAPLAIALPGTFCAPAIFDGLGHALAGHCRLRALSWMTDADACRIPSLAEWVAGRIRADSGEPVVLIGHSTGGAIALQTAAHHPGLLRGLVLINTGPHMRGHGDVDTLIDAITTDGVEAMTRRVMQRSFKVPPPAAELERFLAYGSAIPTRSAVEALTSQRDTDLTAVLPTIHVPVAVVHGRHDPVRTTADAAAMAQTFPNATLQTVDAGHSPMYECPDAVRAIVVELLTRTAR
ncbi:alpha/beta fold hydrolase [Streptomyces sp. NEAU-YJ-81]|uniref:alpha/beta fold hydrolase n=1 Tax=Streptomyces sp. NEAU-YJ-81 TaxID=2820288 RepID=UPI001ABC377F|nr:alpha/beta hydrolase [Streptomyces sp. NEAU-YJ-81]MBO3678644.1 alpha/beta hydrolase [Streptomyces sp. NEAU-YJ-81]